MAMAYNGGVNISCPTIIRPYIAQVASCRRTAFAIKSLVDMTSPQIWRPLIMHILIGEIKVSHMAGNRT